MADTNVLILRDRIEPAALPGELVISAITLAELSVGPHQVGPGVGDEHEERARRTAMLQQVESQFHPVPFDAVAARNYGRVCAAILAAGRSPRGRLADLMIASVSIAEGLPLYTTNPDDFRGLEDLLDVVAVIPRQP